MLKYLSEMKTVECDGILLKIIHHKTMYRASSLSE